MFCNIPNAPDIIFINEISKSVVIFEIGCSFDLYMDTCFTSKLMKYQPLVECIKSLGYNCRFIVLVFGSLGHVHKLVLRGLQLGGLQKTASKRLAKYCSVSATIGSRAIWKRRCFVYPWADIFLICYYWLAIEYNHCTLFLCVLSILHTVSGETHLKPSSISIWIWHVIIICRSK